MLSPNFFNTIFVIPILNILILFYKVFLFLKVPFAFGFSIIALTAFVRAILHPFFKQQMDTAKKMQDLKPHLDKLSSKHKKDPKMLQQAQMKLYKEAGINPAAGCLFLIIQIPIFIGLYTTLSLFFQEGGIQKALTSINNALYDPALRISTIDTHFFGFNLALAPNNAGQWHYYSIPLITALLQYLQVKYTTPQPVSTKGKGKDALAKDSSAQVSDFQKAMNTQMKFIFPIMIGYFSYTLPVGLSLYWNIFSLFSIMQYRKIYSK